MRGANMRIEYDDDFFMLEPCRNIWNHFKITHIFPHMYEKLKNLHYIQHTPESNLNELYSKVDQQIYTALLKAWQDSDNNVTQKSNIEAIGYIGSLADFILQTIQIDTIKQSLKLQENFYKHIESLYKQDLYIELILVDNETMQDLNKQYMAKDYPTDVLSFPLITQDIIESEDTPSQCLGSIIINVYEVCDKAILYQHNLYAELSLLFIHAFLHLLGFDHEEDNGEQRLVEQTIIKSLCLPDSLIVRVDSKD